MRMHDASDAAKIAALIRLPRLLDLAPTTMQTPWWESILMDGGAHVDREIMKMIEILEMLDAPDRVVLLHETGERLMGRLASLLQTKYRNV